MVPSKIVIKDNKQVEKDEKTDEYNSKIEKLKAKKKLVRKNFINDIINTEDYGEINNIIDEEIKKYNILIDGLSDNDDGTVVSYSYEDVKDIIGNIKKNWLYLTNFEKKQFLERFVEEITVDKKNDVVYVIEFKFKKYSHK